MDVELRIQQLNVMIQDDSKNVIEIKKKLAEVERSERMNEYNVMEGSTLSIRIWEARKLISQRAIGANINPYVAVTLNNSQTQETDVVYGSNDPYWNEVLTFDIVTGQEKLIIRVVDRADVGSD
mmetsp:Transcript_25454/g.19201  ORF Transcript_25454/g.19201 Transcript_25454/m.19201 type:complete len:124 (-) Transcript_25454:979-1350(-)|eukprot:CAMPEP_0202966308 /NCGR_PEP_ID=MMETSP1396-20130829/10670_1 /ASSEMBLY_ACC=CAM_ASM_000872 /TAXON_ID= /ORGANISM="Pseudokeronopsis sp., Strain Brazil" /LENGTH=123 /DNA_ID=CAMNT_0049690015 /DNA_START=429 /DNA_END=800 /DNA_ORIENTATION=-